MIFLLHKYIHLLQLTTLRIHLIFMLFVLPIFTCVSMFDSHIFTRCYPFWFFNPPEYLLVQFSSRLLIRLATLAFVFPAVYYYWVGNRADLYLHFHIKCFSFSVEILSFGIFLVNSECDAYLPVDHSLIRGHSKVFLLFFSLILSLV